MDQAWLVKRVIDDLLHEIEIGNAACAVDIKLLLENPQQLSHVAMVDLKPIDYVPHDAHRSCSLADSRTQGWRDPLTQIKVGNLSPWQLSRKKGSAAMSHTGLPAFDKTIQESNTWLKLLMEHLGTNDREYTYRVMKATLHALRDRIGPETAVHLAAQLPMLIRGMYFEGWHPASKHADP
jgi:uncharacterized protein DUF2267